MTIFFLTRHAHYIPMDSVLVGRMAGVNLSEEGYDQARRLAETFVGRGISSVQSSPQARARETATPIAARAGVAMEIAAALDEIDVGAWTGLPFSVLRDDPQWQIWNRSRGSVRPPQGESPQELWTRIVAHLQDMSSAYPDARIVLVSHAEPIRAAILHALNMPMDEFWRIEIAPGSVSTLMIEKGRAEVLAVNEPVAE